MLTARNKQIKKFFEDIAGQLRFQQSDKKKAFFIVTHILPDTKEFFDTIAKFGRIAGIIPKGSFPDKETLDYLSSKYPVVEASKEQLGDGDFAVDFIKSRLEEDEEFECLDIGGYLAPSLKDLCHSEVADRMIGIVEDTQNGETRYKKIIGVTDGTVYSVANSPLKETEDFNVGMNIVSAADQVLRQSHNLYLNEVKNVGVIGFGPVGRSIAYHLKEKGLNVTVYDINPIRLAQAESRHYNVANKADLLKSSDMIFSATGNKGIDGKEFDLLKDGAYVASVTSATDEFDLKWLEKHYSEAAPEGENHINTFSNAKGKEIHLLRRGNAVNFTWKNIPGAYIHMVQAEMLFGLMNAANRREKMQPNEIQTVPDEQRRIVAETWLKDFHQIEPTGPQHHIQQRA